MGVSEIGREELRARIEGGEAVAIVDALAPIAFAHSHLPGAVNLPVELVDERCARLLPDKAAEVVVYCWNAGCESSGEVAERLVELGYANVRHYAAGKQDWEEAGLPLEGGRV